MLGWNDLRAIDRRRHRDRRTLRHARRTRHRQVAPAGQQRSPTPAPGSATGWAPPSAPSRTRTATTRREWSTPCARPATTRPWPSRTGGATTTTTASRSSRMFVWDSTSADDLARRSCRPRPHRVRSDTVVAARVARAAGATRAGCASGCRGPRERDAAMPSRAVARSAHCCSSARSLPDAVPAGGRPTAGRTGARSSELVFTDDFAGDSLGDAWSTCYWWQVDGGCTIASNDEQQWYRPEAVEVTDDMVMLTADRRPSADDRRQHAAVPVGRDHDRPRRQRRRRPRVRVHLRPGRGPRPLSRRRGHWPAVWLLSADRTSLPEIDIMEWYGSRESIITSHVHQRIDGEPERSSHRRRRADVAGEWHDVGVEWSPDRVEFFFDGRSIGQVVDDPDLIPSTPMYLIANLALGGAAGERRRRRAAADLRHRLDPSMAMSVSTHRGRRAGRGRSADVMVRRCDSGRLASCGIGDDPLALPEQSPEWLRAMSMRTAASVT